MRSSIPSSYVRIWCQKNRATISFRARNGDGYQVGPDGIWLVIEDGKPAGVNPRQVFKVTERFPCLQADNLMEVAPQRQLYLNAQKDSDKFVRPVSFDQIADEIESYLSLLGDLPAISYYMAVRSYESGLISLPQASRVANNLNQGETFGAAVLRERMCSWDDLISVCLDLDRIGSDKQRPYSHGFELCGEILIALGKVRRSQLEMALRIKRKGSRPLGEILVEMGACTASDIEASLIAQDQMRRYCQVDASALLGDLLVEQGGVTREDLQTALRLQKAARQPLDALLVSMGAVSAQVIQEFRWRAPNAIDKEGRVNEDMLAQYLLQYRFVSEAQLAEAAHVQKRGRQMVGELLVGLKLCQPSDIDKALDRQRQLRARKEPDKLGQILLQRRLVREDALHKASVVQQKGREKLGTTLVELGACTPSDFTAALEIQYNFRESLKASDDKLGDELLKRGLITDVTLARALELHGRSGKALGQILVEQGACTPEVVIDTLIQRDERRRAQFLTHIAKYIPDKQPERTIAQPQTPAPDTVQKNSGFLSKLFKRNQ